MTTTTATFQSKCQSGTGRENAVAAHEVLTWSIPSEAERILYDRLTKTRAAHEQMQGIMGPHTEVTARMLDEMNTRLPEMSNAQRDCLVDVALTTRGFRTGSIAPVDYDALIEALMAL